MVIVIYTLKYPVFFQKKTTYHNDTFRKKIKFEDITQLLTK